MEPTDPDDLPALLGGRPIRSEGPPPWPRPDPDVQAALAAAVASGAWGQYHGEHVAALESELAALYDVPRVLTCASGTLAVEAALRALCVGPGDEVVMAAYDYESNFLTVHALGAKPVLVDVASHNWNLDPSRLEAAFASRPRAVICSHLHGGIVPMRDVVAIARAFGVGVVEDAAQAAGAVVQGRLAGTWGDAGTLSFGGSKLLTAGRGGALLFRDPQLIQRAKVWLSRGVQQWAPLSELQAAALRPQLAKLTAATTTRGDNVRRLAAGLADVAGGGALVPFENAVEDSVAAFYKVGFRYNGQLVGIPRDVFVRALRAEGVAVDGGFNALHINRSPSRFRAVGDLSGASAAHHGCVVLHHPVLSGSPEEVRQVADAIHKVYRNRDRLSAPPSATSSAPG